MAFTEDLENNKQSDLPLVEIKKEEILNLSGDGIADMATATYLKNQKQTPHKDEASVPVGGKVAMVGAAELSKQKKKY